MTLAVRYANGGTTDRMFNAYLDHDYYLSAPPTGAWDMWDTAYLVMDAPQGEAELKFMSVTNDGAPNIDAFGFNIEGVCRVSEGCPEEVPGDSTDSTTVLKPYTVANVGVTLHGDMLSLSERADVALFDMRGRLVARKIVDGASELSLSSLVKNAGLYRVVVKQGSAKFATTWAKVK